MPNLFSHMYSSVVTPSLHVTIFKCKFCFISWVQYHNMVTSHVFWQSFYYVLWMGVMTTLLKHVAFWAPSSSHSSSCRYDRATEDIYYPITLVASKLDVFMRNMLPFIPQIYQSFFCFALFPFLNSWIISLFVKSSSPMLTGLVSTFFFSGGILLHGEFSL